MKKVLIITYYWPPSGGSGVQRWVYFAHYLHKLGYAPMVLTVDPEKASYRYLDESLLRLVKDVPVIRTSTIEPLKLFSLITTGNTRSGIPHGTVYSGKKTVFKRLAAWLRGNLFIPDARIGWKRFAFKAGEKALQEHKPDIVVTTGPPHTAHLVGLDLKRKHDIKWVADLRDPWTDLYYNESMRQTQGSQKKSALLEQAVLSECDCVLTVGSKLADLLATKIPGEDQIFRFVHNGYDTDLMDRVQVLSHDHFEIAFIGVLSENQPYRSYIKSLQAFIARVGDTQTLKLRFAGNLHEQVQQEFERELPGITIEVEGYVDHEKAIQIMKSAQLLVNCLADMKHSNILISGKLVEYIATGNPVVSFGDKDGESALMIEQFGNGGTYEKGEEPAAAEMMWSTYERWMKGEETKNPSTLERIQSKSRENTTKELAKTLESLN